MLSYLCKIRRKVKHIAQVLLVLFSFSLVPWAAFHRHTPEHQHTNTCNAEIEACIHAVEFPNSDSKSPCQHNQHFHASKVHCFSCENKEFHKFKAPELISILVQNVRFICKANINSAYPIPVTKGLFNKGPPFVDS